MVSPMRLSGLASGLDTDTMIKKLMTAQQAPLNRLLQKKQTEEWSRDQYREMNALLLDLKNKTFDMKMQSTFQNKAVSSESELIVSAKQKGTPSLSAYNVKVSSVSTPAKAASVKFVNNLADASAPIGEGFDFTVGTGTSATTATIAVAATDTMSNVISKINAASSITGVTASYMKDDQSITFTAIAAGGTSAITIGDNTTPADFGTSNKLNLSAGTVNSTTSSFASSQKSADAAAGSVDINGITYSVKSSTFTFDGIEFNIKGTGTTRVNLKPDEDAVFNSIKGFVDKYNEIIDKINSKIIEPKYKDYKPLLDEEKKSLSDKQIEQWETKAKSGLLSRDSLLSEGLTQMRLAVSNNVTAAGIDSKFDSLSEIGITTGTFQEKGKLHIEDAKLRTAISQNGNKVMDLFTIASTATDAATKYKQSGIAQRVFDQLTASMTKLTDKAGSSFYLTDDSTIGKDLRKMDTSINSWKSRLQDMEDRYYRKFSAMETAISKSNSQSGWLTQQFGGGK